MDFYPDTGDVWIDLEAWLPGRDGPLRGSISDLDAALIELQGRGLVMGGSEVMDNARLRVVAHAVEAIRLPWCQP